LRIADPIIGLKKAKARKTTKTQMNIFKMTHIDKEMSSAFSLQKLNKATKAKGKAMK